MTPPCRQGVTFLHVRAPVNGIIRYMFMHAVCMLSAADEVPAAGVEVRHWCGDAPAMLACMWVGH